MIENSKITEKGEITRQFSNLKQILKQESENDKQDIIIKGEGEGIRINAKRILILGSGYVVPPVINFFKNRNDIDIDIEMVIGTNKPEEAGKQFKDVKIVGIDVTRDFELLNDLIQKSDIVIR